MRKLLFLLTFLGVAILVPTVVNQKQTGVYNPISQKKNDKTPTPSVTTTPTATTTIIQLQKKSIQLNLKESEEEGEDREFELDD